MKPQNKPHTYKEPFKWSSSRYLLQLMIFKSVAPEGETSFPQKVVSLDKFQVLWKSVQV